MRVPRRSVDSVRGLSLLSKELGVVLVCSEDSRIDRATSTLVRDAQYLVPARVASAQWRSAAAFLACHPAFFAS